MSFSSFRKTARLGLIYGVLYAISITLIASAIFPRLRLMNDVPSLGRVVIVLSFLYLIRYFIYTIVSPWYDARWEIQKAENQTKLATHAPKVSVLIPCWNEEVGLVATVKSVLASDYENLEVVVINDGSMDGSDKVMRHFLKETKPDLQNTGKSVVYHYKANGGKGSALNKGIELATGEIIMTIDADCIVHKDAIKNFAAHFIDPKVMAAVGNVKIMNTSSLLVTIQSLEFLFSFYFKRADSVLGSIYIIGGAAGAFRKEVFEKLGGYNDTNITEDIELTVRIQEAGMKIVYAADAIIYTEGADDFRGLVKQRLRWKRGRIDTFVQYKKLFFSLKRRHNKFLTWFVLPFAILGDTELAFEIPFILFLYIISMMTGDYSPFLAAFLIVTFVFYSQIFGEDSRYNKKSVYLLAPIGWLLFYAVTFIELIALVKSLWSIYRNQKIKWQSWKRVGIQPTSPL